MNNILIIGLDEKGCNFAKFLKSKKTYGEVNGYDLDFDVFKKAINGNFVDNKEYDNFEKIIIRSDFIILNIPADKYDLIFLKLSPFVQKDSIITDLNSSKEYVYKFKKKLLNIRKENYIQSNCLFNFENIDSTKNKKVLINSSISSNLENINRLSLFWKLYGFDTENMNVIDNDRIMSKILHFTFILKKLFNKVFGAKFSNENDFFVICDDKINYLFGDVVLNKDNLIIALKRFSILLAGFDFSQGISRAFFDKAIYAREKLKKISKIYGLKKEREKSDGGIVNAINFLFETIFVGYFIDPREHFYLNMDIFNFSLSGGEEFICLKTIEENKEEFLKAWCEFVNEIKNFYKFLSENNNLKVKDIVRYVKAN